MLTLILRRKDKSTTILKISYIPMRNLHCRTKLIRFIASSQLWQFQCQCCILRFDSVAIECKESYSGVLCIPQDCHNQLQKYLRHCTIFWLKWPVHNLVLVISPSLNIKVVGNTRPCSKLGGTTLNGEEEGGEYYVAQKWDHQRSQKSRFYIEVSQDFCNWL